MTALARHEYVRAHGLGNDYLIVDGTRFGLPLTPERVRRVCDRHRGVGSDGILELAPAPEGFDAAVRIHNPDGSEAEKSGNGVRLFAKFLLDHGYVQGDRVRLHTLGGPVEARLLARTPEGARLEVALGTASFRCADLPMVPPDGAAEWVQHPLEVAGHRLRATCLSVGNPHCVLFDAPFDEASARLIGPMVEHLPCFPRRTNVQLIRVVDRATVEALIWERGAGFTASSGSSSCAVAAACVRSGLTDRRVRVIMPGGSVEVRVGEDLRLDQIGEAQEIARGSLSPELVAALT